MATSVTLGLPQVLYLTVMTLNIPLGCLAFFADRSWGNESMPCTAMAKHLLCWHDTCVQRRSSSLGYRGVVG